MEFENRFDKNVWNFKGCWQKKKKKKKKIILEFQNNSDKKSFEFQHPLGAHE